MHLNISVRLEKEGAGKVQDGHKTVDCRKLKYRA